MADHEGVKESQIVMFRREESIKPRHTPESLSLHVADIIGIHLIYVDVNSAVLCTLLEPSNFTDCKELKAQT